MNTSEPSGRRRSVSCSASVNIRQPLSRRSKHSEGTDSEQGLRIRPARINLRPERAGRPAAITSVRFRPG